MIFRQFAYRNVVRNSRIYAAFFMASVFSVMVFFLYSMLLFHPSIENRFVQEIAKSGMITAQIILYIFTLFFLFYSMRAFLQARTKEFGILLHLGMAKKQLHRLIFIETMIIGTGSILAGTFLGYMFSKFFFMIVKNIVMLPALPLYLSWKPFALTVGVFLSLFVIISWVAPIFIRTGQVADLLQHEIGEADGYSPARAYIGILLLVLSYTMAALTSHSIVIGLLFLLPPLATIGTYLFFTDSLPMVLHKIRRRKRLYWHHFWLLSISEGVVRLRENARMFFIVSIVSTIAFMSVGILASLTSFASQYREMHPLGLVYKSEIGNELEGEHMKRLVRELHEEEIEYSLVKFDVLEQKSSFTNNSVRILKQSDIDLLAGSFDYEAMDLEKGEALFLPPSISSYEQLADRRVQTVLEESGVQVEIVGAYPHHLFSAYSMGMNAIILNDVDYNIVADSGPAKELKAFTYYAFNVPEWQETKNVGLLIEARATDSFLSGTSDQLLYSFENPGLNYSVIRTTFSLLLFIGLLLAAVFFLAAGSFIYFRLYTSLDRDRKQFDVLRRMGITDREVKKVVNRQLIPQFFFPWGVAFAHSSFAFLSLQVIWDALAEISIVKELTIVLAGFAVMQVLYFYLIRWRYLVHIKAAG
ncbi:ABC-type antimicrobial peptide transport system, permease component [Bacillus sp. OxB-1]|uniref:FtsX-like permease family protein n=1 Tax=Bacillus sp. (strain OxB-1) TaxID=98228 RepID=UPI000581CA0F|nr:ABC transporter permease [Bacillus sp. OxB-1]BAQ10142.1 ABC-type antimicrobial peptide transport system, permease component [Bacillus sp. OxB-1]